MLYEPATHRGNPDQRIPDAGTPKEDNLMTAAILGPCDAGFAEGVQRVPCAHPDLTLAACILGSSLAFIDGSVVNVALPSLAADLSASASNLPWIVAAYLLPLSALILLGGALGDTFGRRYVFIAGIIVFLVASAVCAVAPTFGWLIFGRCMQGSGAALLMPNSLAILGASFSGEEKGSAIGTWAGVGALAGALGPLLGGWLVEHIGWRSIFALNLPIGVAAVWLAWKYVPDTRGRDERKLDIAGAVVVTVGLALLTLGLTIAANPASERFLWISAVMAGIALLGAFVWLEAQRGDRALMPIFLVASRSFAGVSLLTFFLYAALGGLIVLLPYLLMQVKGYSPVQAGAAMLPIPIMIGVSSSVMGRIAERFGSRLLLCAGALLVAAGLALYGRVTAISAGYWQDVFPATAVISLGMALSVAPLTATVMSSVDAGYVGAASGFNSAVARIGGLIATVMLGFVFSDHSTPAAFLEGFHNAAWVGAGLSMVAAICAFYLIESPPREAAAASAGKPAVSKCTHAAGIAKVTPSALGCEECLKTGSKWFHLRLCRTCGHVGCCDQSPGRHATKHFEATGHPIIEGYDPPEVWGWCFVDETMIHLGKDVTKQLKPIPRYY